jgi:hypothetical protein
VTELLTFAALVVVVLAAGIAIGKLTAPRLTRLADADEEPRAGDDPAAD